MAPRKSAQKINARKKALEAAAAFQERENRLIGYAEDFFKIYETSGAAAIEKRSTMPTSASKNSKQNSHTLSVIPKRNKPA